LKDDAMTRLTDRFLAVLDRLTESGVRASAQRLGRRSALSWLGAAVAGGTIGLPMLPFDRSGAGSALARDEKTDADCEYWRYCALDGFLCSCCGGSVSQCPPGAVPSAVTWIGTCQYQGDGKAYLIAYHDCCGKASCGRCLCNFNVGERPGYRMAQHNDINWCMANRQINYHCTVARVVGLG
jgi:methylamine dehydrogenase light chain